MHEHVSAYTSMCPHIEYIYIYIYIYIDSETERERARELEKGDYILIFTTILPLY
jgi:restriction endonuclease